MLKIKLLNLSCSILLALSLVQCTVPEAEDVLPPLVTLIYPVNGSVISGNIVVTVQASDDREVLQIWYTLDGTIIEKSSAARADFQLDLTEYADEQNHVFQAGAVDNSGNNNVSDQVIVTISETGDIVPPTVTITNPLTGQEVVDTTTVIADALDDNYISEVAFYVNGDSVGRDLSYPYEYIWSVTDFPIFTSQTIYARAFDGARNRTSSNNVTITVVPSIDQVAPLARLLFPLEGQILYGVVRVQVDASDDRLLDRVEFYVNGILESTVDASSGDSPYSYAWDTRSLAPTSQHSLFFKAIDAAGNESDNDAILFTIGGSLDTEPPNLVLLYPQDGDTLTGTVTVSVDVSDNVGVDRVEYYVDGGQAGTGLPNFIATSPPWSYDWDTNGWADGLQHTLYIRAVDTSENQTTEGPLTFTIF
jgi:hypothetical protein